jgi:hypothetical protein
MKITSLNLLIGGAALLLASCSSGEKSAPSPASSLATEPGKTAGAYQLKVTANVGGDIADGRFSSNR